MHQFLKLNDNCRFYPYDSGRDKDEFILRTPEGRQFKISALAKSILEQLDGVTGLDHVTHSLRANSVPISEEELRALIETKYATMGIFDGVPPEGGTNLRADASRKGRNSFLLYWNLIPEKHVGTISSKLAFLYRALVAVPALLLIIVAHFIVYSGYLNPSFLSAASFSGVLVLCLISILFHEFGHAAAVSRYGGTPGSIGFALYLLIPSFYADVSEIWRFSRKRRMVVDLGGVYFQLLVFAVFTFLGVATAAPEYFIACHLIDLMVLLTLNPIFQFDGYWLLVDYMALPKLYLLALNYIKYSVKNLFSRTKELIILPPMPRHVYVGFLLYALLCNAFMLAIVWLSSRYLYSTFTRFPAIFLGTFRSMVFAIKTQDFFLFLNRLLTMFFVIAFPGTALIGLSRYTARLVKFGVRKIQASITSHNP